MLALARTAQVLGGELRAAALAVVARSPLVSPGTFGIRPDGCILEEGESADLA
jgi:hypothetical protein